MRPQPSPEPPIVLIIKAFLAVAAIIMAILFVSFLQADYHFEFRKAEKPAPVPKLLSDDPSGWLSERDIPIETQLAHINLPDYDFTQPVPEVSAADISYFNDTVFIGDSRTTGLLMYTKLKPYDFSGVGLNVSSIMKKSYIKLTDESGKTETYTLLEALEKEKGKYKAIYFCLGLNELGWEVDSFMRAYREAIEAIRTVTDVPIYAQLIMPVTVEAAETSQFGITNDKAILFNDALREYAAEAKLFLLDPTGLFALEDGTLDPQVAYDGIHLNPGSYAKLADFFRSHYVLPVDYANVTAGGSSDAPQE